MSSCQCSFTRRPSESSSARFCGWQVCSRVHAPPWFFSSLPFTALGPRQSSPGSPHGSWLESPSVCRRVGGRAGGRGPQHDTGTTRSDHPRRRRNVAILVHAFAMLVAKLWSSRALAPSGAGRALPIPPESTQSASTGTADSTTSATVRQRPSHKRPAHPEPSPDLFACALDASSPVPTRLRG